MKIADFINDEFKSYVNYDNYRSLPHIMDGLKVTERKVLNAFVEHIGYQKIVCDKAGMRAADLTKYHHGATSMIGVLVGMNQDFVGSNTLPLFDKFGQFGTRLNHKASSERYISTKLNENYKKLFDSDDIPILNKQYDDGDLIEPEFYLPKLPLLLINGAEGTGNGYKSRVLSYEVDEVKQAVQEVLKTGLVQTKLTPYLKGFEGNISKDHETGQVTFEGNFERKNTTTIIITELPPKQQLESYKAILNSLMDKTKQKDGVAFNKDYDKESTEDQWRFVIDCPRTTTALTDKELMDKFKLVEKQTETLVAWMPNGKLKVFNSVEQLIETWVGLRLEFYEKRRINKIASYVDQIHWLTTKLNFIKFWNQSSATLVKLNRSDLVASIIANVTDNKDFIDRLLSIRVSNLALDEVTSLNNEINKLQAEKLELENTTNKVMMTKELKSLKL